MASIIPGFEYDIFISYRQKDNLPTPGYGRQGNGERWVSEFVESLKTEIESTFKEEISVYFDINPHDGLLETHDVDASLREKLKCLVFIPIISRTYCDPGSFAWSHEFKAFISQASQDNFGLKIKLPDGNVAGRILPVRIHDIDADDNTLLETELGGFLRAVDFIYREPGVNRPLSPVDDVNNNLNKTKYRNQINKVANAIKEIISGLKGDQVKPVAERREFRSASPDTKMPEKSIAVLPFLDLSPGKDQDYFCDGITEEIINALAHIENFKVIARTSAFAFRNKQVDIREIGGMLNVKTVLEGSIRKAGNRLRITVQLINADDGSHIWSERYDREMEDVFAIQDEISVAIADKLKIKLLGETKAIISGRRSENLEAYNLYLKGTYSYQSLTVDGLMKAKEFFEQALHKDPGYALAFVGLGYIYWLSSMWGNVPPDRAYPKAEEYVKKALEIDSTLAEAYSVLATINTFYHWDWSEAEKYFRYALRINPNSSMIHTNYSVMLVFARRYEEAISESMRAQELDPLSAYINTRVGMAFFYSGNYEKAIAEYQAALTINAGYFFTHLNLGNTYLAKNMLREAAIEYRKAVDLSNGTPVAVACLLVASYQTGEDEKANKIFDEFKARSESEYIPASFFYMVYRVLGNEYQAIEWLKKAFAERDTFLLWIKDLPRWFPENSHYSALLKIAGL